MVDRRRSAGRPGVERALLDETLLDHEAVWGGAGTPAAVAAFDPAAIRDATDAGIAPAFE